MKIELIKEKRKTIVLTIVDADKAILKVPKNLSEKKIDEFLESKKKWLSDKSLKMKQNKKFSEQFDLNNQFYLFGERVDSFDKLIFGFDAFSEKEKLSAVRKVYLSHFSNLEAIASDLSVRTGFVYERIKFTDSVRIWGSFNVNNVMKLNWKLLLLPERLVEYVIIHELCHSKHMNHKPQFWKEVEKFCPNFKALKKELNQYAFLLKSEF